VVVLYATLLDSTRLRTSAKITSEKLEGDV